jgi:hypothetical protein
MKFSNLSIFFISPNISKIIKKGNRKKETKFARIGPAHQVAPVGVNPNFITTGGD